MGYSWQSTCSNQEANMKTKLVGALPTFLILALFFTTTPEGRGQAQPQPPKSLTTEQKLDRILDRLEKIEKRLDELAPSRLKGLAPPLKPEALKLAPKTWAFDDSTGLPHMEEKPEPRATTFNGCPPQGQGGDPELNRLKNRVDKWHEWIPVKFDSVLNLGVPKNLPQQRAKWPPATREQVSRYEGIPISIEGYIIYTKEEGPESCNCKEDSDDMVDYHMNLVKSTEDDKSDSIVVEVTPRIRADHPKWTYDVMKTLKKSEKRVRVSG